MEVETRDHYGFETSAGGGRHESSGAVQGGRTSFVDDREPFPCSKFYTGTQTRPSRLRYRGRDRDDDNPYAGKQQPRDYSKKDTNTKFGTWKGVFVSCLLNIFGVIMFLRLGWVVGNEGILGATLIIILSSIVTVLTTLSMSAIATNGEVKAGGAYYLISRALGPAIGGAVGILFSLGMSIACALYILGCCETIVDNLGMSLTGNTVNDVRIYSFFVLTILFVAALIGVNWIIKMQLVLLCLLMLSMLSFIIGSLYKDEPPEIVGMDGWTNGNMMDNFMLSGDVGNFFHTFSVFFPAVTGIMAGANISGSLKDPSKNIPDGTLAACGFSTAVYILMVFILGATVVRGSKPEVPCQGEGLAGNCLIMADVSFFAPLIYMGVYAATLSSALSSLVGAPRVLQSVAADKLVPGLSYFAEMNRNQDPERAYYFTYVVALACCMLGDLNLVAPLITMFFMITYAMINFACFELSISGSPGWRPYFKYYNKWTALAGVAFCISIMFLINPAFAAGALVLAGAIHRYISFKNPAVNWGVALDARRHMNAMEKVRFLRRLQPHVKNFRPGFLVLIKDQEDEADKCLITFIETLSHAYGTDIYLTVNVPDSGHWHDDHALVDVTKSRKYLSRRHGNFYEKLVAPDLRTGAHIMMQIGGLGRLRPNTLVMGFPERWADRSSRDRKRKAKETKAMLHDALVQNHGFMMVRNMEAMSESVSQPQELRGAVDVWWLVDSGGLALLVPHLMSLHSFWKQRTRERGRCPMRLILVSAEHVANKDQRDLDDFERVREIGAMHKNLSYEDMWAEEIKTLLKKLRMDFFGPVEIRSGRAKPRPETVDEFLKLCALPDDARLENHVLNWLRISELVASVSRREASVFISAPFPELDDDPVQYMGILDMCTKAVPNPVVMIRGAGRNVVTTKLE